VKLLLDTHALLWWWTDDKQLSTAARAAIADERNTVLVSAASVWEISTKYRLGKLVMAATAMKQFPSLIEADGFEHLPITWQHSLRAGAYTAPVCGYVNHRSRAARPTNTPSSSPTLTAEGVRSSPKALGINTACPSCHTDTSEWVVPRSMPISKG
jgi:PIN domain nuclease of toxin-antitoxin system